MTNRPLKMKQTVFYCFCIFCLQLAYFKSSAQEIELCKDGKTRYRIVISEQAKPEERQAAADLQSYLKQISGTGFPIESDAKPLSEYEIVIGQNKHLEQIEVATRTSNPGLEGFRVFTKNTYLVFTGGAKKGIRYGVYDFLERYLGCRMYTPEAVVIPKTGRIVIPPVDNLQEPAFAWRETWHRTARKESAFSDWNRLNTYEERKKDWGMFVHTFDVLIPEKVYFDAHPEWFSEINGKRVRDGQLCLSNEEGYRELVKNLRKKMAERPECGIWSVSNNDNYNACECEKCRASDSQYQSPAGTLLVFVNRIAREFPDKTISTLGYQFTRKAPVGIVPEKNVNIMFCSIECDRSRPLANNPEEQEFCSDMKNWASLTRNLFMWDYVVQFRNYLDPFPNLHVLQPNLQFFAQNHCRMMFEQGSDGNVTEFSDLRTYLLAKLMWNPYCNVDSVLNDYLNGYYGKAGTFIRQYIDTMRTALLASGKRLDIYGYPVDAKNSYLTPRLLKTYAQLFAQASDAVKSDPVLTRRVKEASIPLEFAILDLSMHDLSPGLTYFSTDKTGQRIANAAMITRLRNFVSDCKKFSITSLQEFPYTPERYEQNVLHFVEKGLTPNLAFGKPVKLLTSCSPKYDVGSAKALNDGKFGMLDYHYNWLGFEENHLEAVIDLEKPVPINRISIDFLVMPLSWIFLPNEVAFYISDDEKNWKLFGSQSIPQPEDLNQTFIQKYEIASPKQSGRYIKIKAISSLTCPEWHRGWGKPSWIFADEVVVQ